MSIETEAELKALKQVGQAVARALAAMRAAVEPGISTAEIDQVAETSLDESGARAAPRLQYGFPAVACISVNEDVVHGIPGSRLLADGDLVTLDVTAELDGYYADAAVTVGVGTLLPTARALIDCAEAAFLQGARVARQGERLATVGGAVDKEVRRRGFRVLSDLCGHGIGRSIHEEPAVANYFDRRERTRLTHGLVIALEPIVTAGSDRIVTRPDGWTIASADGSLTAHFEHTIVITRGAPLLLTAA